MIGGTVTDKPTLASMCVQCENCLEKCPQHLPIPDLLNDVQEDMEGFLIKPFIWMGKRLIPVSFCHHRQMEKMYLPWRVWDPTGS